MTTNGIKVKLKGAKKRLVTLSDAPRRLTREERRAATRARKKQLRKTPMKEKSWANLYSEYENLKDQIKATREDVISNVQSGDLDVEGVDDAPLQEMRKLASELAVVVTAFEAEIDKIMADIGARPQTLSPEDVAEYDDLDMALLDFQMQFIAQVTAPAVEIASTTSEYIEKLEAEKEKLKAEQPKEEVNE